MNHLPWQPIFTIERSNLPEITVFGIVAVVTDATNTQQSIQHIHPLIRVGDVNYTLWSRSLLKPWQLLSHIAQLKNGFSALNDEHFALMMSSHNAEPHQLALLDQIAHIGNIDLSLLKCPAAYPKSALTRAQLQAEGKPAQPIFHMCSGKHLSYLLDVKLRNGDQKNYTEPQAPQFTPLKKLLALVLDKSGDIPTTTDGCQLPNYGLSIIEMASLYRMLLSPCPSQWMDKATSDLAACLNHINTIGMWMHSYPSVIGGENRLDSRIMLGQFAKSDLTVIAKDGADGLLAVAIAPCDKYPYGVGMLIKLSSGYDVRHMEIVVSELLTRLGLAKSPPIQCASHIKTVFHF